jgi:hypothetical protein
MVNLIKNIVKSKENEIINAKQYENKSGSVNIVMGRVVCELLSTQYLGPRTSVLEMDSNFAGHKTIKKGFSNHHFYYMLSAGLLKIIPSVSTYVYVYLSTFPFLVLHDIRIYYHIINADTYLPFLKIQSSSDFISFTKISISIGFSTK